MKKMIKGNWLYIFILINPIFDILSSLFNNIGTVFTPSTIMRPIIPLILLIYIFITDKSIRGKGIILSITYLLYITIHLFFYKNMMKGISFGSVFHELQYLVNYTYLIFTGILFVYVFYKKKHQLVDYLFYYTIFYISSIYLAIISNTSSSSYVEGLGYKGWYNTSGAIGAILITSLFVLLPYLAKKEIKVIYKFTFVLSIVLYLCFLIGSRVGLFGSLLVLLIYGISNLTYYLINSKKINIKKYLPIIASSILILVVIFIFFGSYTLERRKQLADITDNKIHISYDVLDIKKSIDNNTLESNYMSNEQKRAIISLYNYANENKMANTDLRTQQLVYHSYLYIYQRNIPLKLFGNGYLANFGALTLEMEGIALFFNFGIFGFILFAMPFLGIFIYGFYKGIKNIKKVDVEYIMYMSGIFTSYVISSLAGHVYFNTSVMPVIIIIHLLLLNKINTWEVNKQK